MTVPEISTMVQELEGLRTQATKVLEDHQKDGLTTEARQQLDVLRQQMAEKKTAIDTARADDERKADIQRIGDFLDRPQYKVPRGTGTEPGDLQAGLLKAGWEIKGQSFWAPSSLGHVVEMYPEELILGPIPTEDHDQADYYRKTRAILQPEYAEAFRRFVKLVARTGERSMAFQMLGPEYQKALSEGSDTAGGFLVPPQMEAEVLARKAQMAVIRKYARVQPTTRDILQWPRVQAHATSGSIYTSAFVGSWVGETPAATDTDPVFGTFGIPVKKIRAMTKLSNDLVNDSATNIIAFLSRDGAENMALVEDDGFVAGDGTALKPVGLINAGIATVDVEGSTVDTISNTTTNAGSAPKIINLCYALPSQYLAGARWLMRRAIEGDIRVLIDAQGRYHWPVTGFGATPRELLGYPVENSEFMPNDGTNANTPLLFGDLGQYIIAQRTGMAVRVLNERFADTEQVGFIMTERVGGAVHNPDAFRLGVV